MKALGYYVQKPRFYLVVDRAVIRGLNVRSNMVKFIFEISGF